MMEYDLKKDFITDNYGLVGIIFRGIIALEHVRKHDEHLASQNVVEQFELEIIRRTKTVLLQICRRRYNVRLKTGQRTRKFRLVFKMIPKILSSDWLSRPDQNLKIAQSFWDFTWQMFLDEDSHSNQLM